MITAIDTNIVLDVLISGAPHGDSSEQLLEDAARSGATIISEPVYSELAANFSQVNDLEEFLSEASIRVHRSGAEALFLAGKAWQSYRQRRPSRMICASCGAMAAVSCVSCNSPLAQRQHVLADFQIGAHAIVHADRLLTRDRGYYRTYFPELILV
ncbi:MAG: type II toxin-antitoxin system VapC family toxin [SAR202 cluster bacterium]|nr:type II toxin-antitoxin system VapC family toxin [SAR202 cluster bacterium]